MTIESAIDAIGRTISVQDLWAEKSQWGIVLPLLCGSCQTMTVKAVRAHKRLGQTIDPHFRAQSHQEHLDAECPFASKSPVAGPDGTKVGLPIRLEMLPNGPTDLDQTVTTLDPEYPVGNPKPRRAIRIGEGPATGRLVVQNAEHAYKLIQALEASIAAGNPPHDLVYEGARIPWEYFYFDLADDARAEALRKIVHTVTHPIALRFTSTGWVQKVGQYKTRWETAPNTLEWLHIATSTVPKEALPVAGHTSLYYGLARLGGPDNWYWVDDERNIKIFA